MVEPFLDDGLAVASSDAHDRNVVFVAMPFSQSLQGLDRVRHLQEVGIGVSRLPAFRQLFDNKIIHATLIKVSDIAMTVIS